MDLIRDLDAFLQTLERSDVPYMLVGGIALESLGVPRATLDIDIQVAMKPPADTDSSFLGWVVEERSIDPVFRQRVVILHRPTSAIPFELFFTDHWFTSQALQRRRRVRSRLLDRTVPLPSVEDFLLLKASYMASPTRPRAKAVQDRLDLEGVVANHRGKLDEEYLHANSARLHVSTLIKELLATGTKSR